jgi:hypothetical protein
MIFVKKKLTPKNLINSLIFFLIIIVSSTYIDFKKTANSEIKRISLEIKLKDPRFNLFFDDKILSFHIGKLLEKCINPDYGATILTYKFNTYNLIYYSDRDLDCKYHDLKKIEYETEFEADLYTNLIFFLEEVLENANENDKNYKYKKNIPIISSIEVSFKHEILLPKSNPYDPRPILVFVLMITLFYLLLKYHNEKN